MPSQHPAIHPDQELDPTLAKPAPKDSKDGKKKKKRDMSWRSSGTSNASLVENLWRNKLITQPLVKQAFLRVDRAHYAPASPYEDSPQSIGHRATISAPHMHASAIESLLPFLLPTPPPLSANNQSSNSNNNDNNHNSSTSAGSISSGSGGDDNNNHASSASSSSALSAQSAISTSAAIDVPATTRSLDGGPARPPPVCGKPGRPRRVLDVGSGSGYLTHVLAELAGNDALVVGLEHIRPLQELGQTNMGRSAEGRRLLEEGRVRFRLGDGRKGWVEPAAAAGTGDDATPPIDNNDDEDEDAQGWDAIHVGAAAAELHENLVRQLRRPGRMFIPVSEGYDQFIWTVDKDEQGNVRKDKLYGVRYVPLTDAYV